jgi:hypothetical protein
MKPIRTDIENEVVPDIPKLGRKNMKGRYIPFSVLREFKHRYFEFWETQRDLITKGSYEINKNRS